jgi:anti-sigma B factor antagonist
MGLKEFEYSVRRVGEASKIIALDLKGGVFVSNLNDFKEIISIQQNRLIEDLILNFEELDFISSSGIGVLVEKSESMKKTGKRLWVVGPNEEIARVFNQFYLEKIINILPDEKSAVEIISRSGPPAKH